MKNWLLFPLKKNDKMAEELGSLKCPSVLAVFGYFSLLFTFC